MASCGVLDLYDAGGGTLVAAWNAFSGLSPSSYNVYVNGALNQNVAVKRALITRLTEASYNAASGVITPPATVTITVAAVVAGVEAGVSVSKTITMQPTTIALITPMKRLWPFPNTGLD